jgi:hypothetical protein
MVRLEIRSRFLLSERCSWILMLLFPNQGLKSIIHSLCVASLYYNTYLWFIFSPRLLHQSLSANTSRRNSMEDMYSSDGGGPMSDPEAGSNSFLFNEVITMLIWSCFFVTDCWYKTIWEKKSIKENINKWWINRWMNK